MGIFDRFRKSKSYDIQQTTYQKINPSIFENGMFIEREDKTNLDITPKLDKAGNQMYKQVYDPVHKKMVNLGIWLINYKTVGFMEADYLEPDEREIYFDECVIPEWFEDCHYRDSAYQSLCNYLVNTVLSRERLKKIVEEREGYAGTIVRDENGFFRKHINSGIIKELRMERATGVPSVIRHRQDIERTGQNRMPENIIENDYQ